VEPSRFDSINNKPKTLANLRSVYWLWERPDFAG